MTSRVVRQGPEHPTPGLLKEIVIGCDHMSCTTAITDGEIRAAGGLKEMGWEATAVEGTMRHYCPEHRRTPRSN